MLTEVSQNDKLTQPLICIVAFYFFLSIKKLTKIIFVQVN